MLGVTSFFVGSLRAVPCRCHWVASMSMWKLKLGIIQAERKQR